MRSLGLLTVTLLALLCCILPTISCASIRSTEYREHVVLRVDNSYLTPEQEQAFKAIDKMKEFKIDRWSRTDIRVPPSTRSSVERYLLANKLAYSIWIPDVQAEIDREDRHRAEHRNKHGDNVLLYKKGADDFFKDYHSMADITSFTANLALMYPHLVNSSVIGHTYGQNPITVFVVTGKPLPSGQRKPAIYLEGGIHAREWIAHATVTYMLNALVTGYGTDAHITKLLDNFEYHLVPVVNVDGYLYTWSTDRMWRKTVKPNPGSSCIGTDPNRNWDNHWCLPDVGGSTDPCDESYCGSAPFSEACVKVVADYVTVNENIVAAIDFHSYSQMWMTPYGYTSGLPSNFKQQNDMSIAAVNALQSVYGTKYVEGPIYSTVYPASGSSADYFFDNTTHVKYSFGVELRDTGASGFLLPADQIIPSGIETLAAVMAMGDYLMNTPGALHDFKQAEKKGREIHFGNLHQFARRAAPTETAAQPSISPLKAHKTNRRPHNKLRKH